MSNVQKFDRKPRVAVVFGGRSSEHGVSVVTAASVLSAIDRDKYDVLPIGITTEGRWALTADAPERMAIADRRMPTVEQVADQEGAVALPLDPASREVVYTEAGAVPKALGEVDVALAGAVDELNAAIGMARAATKHEFLRENLVIIQKELVNLMGELATLKEDFPKYLKDGYSTIKPEMTARLEKTVREIEAQNINFKGWATPGANGSAASLDMARTVSRRAERRVCALQEAGELENKEILVYIGGGHDGRLSLHGAKKRLFMLKGNDGQG